ncbi:hypothetical protein CBM2626_A40015 [Cupriavidus taiwanensis]|nr:hypothetical protein CBM2626_A40015 [Cupriavidus taiwanensis]
MARSLYSGGLRRSRICRFCSSQVLRQQRRQVSRYCGEGTLWYVSIALAILSLLTTALPSFCFRREFIAGNQCSNKVCIQ